ncbi:hypothetical protein M0802_012415 [Mischocyttarus mexicanus]|nr:hypothetical protein M0802_012415 [Mischocyttarus mexicanus]
MSGKRKLPNTEVNENLSDPKLRRRLKEFYKSYSTKGFPEVLKHSKMEVKPNLLCERNNTSSVASEGSPPGAGPSNEGEDFKAPRKTAKPLKAVVQPPIKTHNIFGALDGASEMPIDAVEKDSDAPAVRTNFDEKTVIVRFHDMEHHSNAVAMLKTENVQYYTFTPRHLKGKSLVLKGVKGGFEATDVLEEINSLNLEGVLIERISKMTFNRNTPDRYHFLVTLSHNSVTAPLWKCKYILNQRCRWERLRRPPIFQCKNCQRVGHAATNCNLKAICPKCAGIHKVIDCPIKDTNDRTKYRCTNCDEYGHSAAYKGCPMIKITSRLVIESQKQKKKTNARRLAAYDKMVTPGTSFANMAARTNQNSPPIQEVQPRNIYAGMPKPNYQSNASSSSNDNRGANNLEALLINFKNEILNEMNKLNTKIINNAAQTCIPHDRNLTIEEIDQYIIELEKIILDAITTTIPKHNPGTTKYYLKYENKTIRKLHACKSALITGIFKNTLLNRQGCPDEEDFANICSSGYIPPELFTLCDKHGLIQDENNLPVLYHIKRHCTDKTISLEPNLITRNSFSTALPNIDKRDTHRLSKAYWWLTQDAKYIDEIRRRSLWEKQHPNQRLVL